MRLIQYWFKTLAAYLDAKGKLRRVFNRSEHITEKYDPKAALDEIGECLKSLSSGGALGGNNQAGGGGGGGAAADDVTAEQIHTGPLAKFLNDAQRDMDACTKLARKALDESNALQKVLDGAVTPQTYKDATVRIERIKQLGKDGDFDVGSLYRYSESKVGKIHQVQERIRQKLNNGGSLSQGNIQALKNQLTRAVTEKNIDPALITALDQRLSHCNAAAGGITAVADSGQASRPASSLNNASLEVASDRGSVDDVMQKDVILTTAGGGGGGGGGAYSSR